MSDAQLIAKLKLAADASSVAARALSLIDKPSRWTKFGWALNRRGRPVTVGAEEATRFCLVGAVLRADIELHRAVVCTDCSRWLRPAIAYASNRVKLVLDLLALEVREHFEEVGRVVWIDDSSDLAAIDGMAMCAHDLPAIYNTMERVSHRDVFSLLLESGSTLIEAAQSPELVGTLVANRRLLDRASGPRVEL